MAGDALLTDAFALVATSDYPDTVRAQMTAALSVGAGSHGMVAGQVRDMLGEHQQLSLPALTQLHQEKTGALLQAAMKMGLAAVDASERDKRALARFLPVLLGWGSRSKMISWMPPPPRLNWARQPTKIRQRRRTHSCVCSGLTERRKHSPCK